MTDLIPAAPGWYVHETVDHEIGLDPVIAWYASTDHNGDLILLPYVNGGMHQPPILLTPESFKEWRRHIVYRPNHDPGNGDWCPS
ncbi:hypothetical protein [Streptomyces sp. NPDC059957]|uniref:hypothetical protein n=1 Tax=unclassified Streptomyces TaxID=2593676 RepID=UPI003659F68F